MVSGSAVSNREVLAAFVTVCDLRMRINGFSRWSISLSITMMHPPPLTIIDYLNLGTADEATTIREARAIPLFAKFARFHIHVMNASQRFAVFRYRGPNATSGDLWPSMGITGPSWRLGSASFAITRPLFLSI
jgi:hypothetical protein